jgi:hypothetical protein
VAKLPYRADTNTYCANCGRKETQNHQLIYHGGKWWCPGACRVTATRNERLDRTISQAPGLKDLDIFKAWDSSGRPGNLIVDKDGLEAYISYLDDRREAVGDTRQQSQDIPITLLGCNLLEHSGKMWMWSDVTQRDVKSKSALEAEKAVQADRESGGRLFGIMPTDDDD